VVFGLRSVGGRPSAVAVTSSLIAVIDRHSFQNTFPQDRTKRFGASSQDLFDFRPGRARKPVEHESFRISYRMIGFNANSKPRELIVADRPDN
jgi:hypothetical protein